MAIEEEFSIEIPDKDADAIHSGKSCFWCVRGPEGITTGSYTRQYHSTLGTKIGPCANTPNSGQGRRVHSFSTRCALNQSH